MQKVRPRSHHMTPLGQLFGLGGGGACSWKPPYMCVYIYVSSIPTPSTFLKEEKERKTDGKNVLAFRRVLLFLAAGRRCRRRRRAGDAPCDTPPYHEPPAAALGLGLSPAHRYPAGQRLVDWLRRNKGLGDGQCDAEWDCAGYAYDEGDCIQARPQPGGWRGLPKLVTWRWSGATPPRQRMGCGGQPDPP